MKMSYLVEFLQAMTLWSTRRVARGHPHTDVPNAGVKNASADTGI